MSFSGQAKTEIEKRLVQKPCCVRAGCWAFACFAKYYDEKGLVLQTERPGTAAMARRLFRRMGLRGEVTARQRPESRVYEFALKDPAHLQMLQLSFGRGQQAVQAGGEDLFVCPDCLHLFYAVAFLCCGTVADPAREYSLEFAVPHPQMAGRLAALLQQGGFAPRQLQRRSARLLYFKASEQVEDLLTAMGATSASLAVMQEKVYKELRNKANRITNCESANIDKLVAASGAALRAVRVLKQGGRFDTLPADLQAVAALREQYPEYSLAELGQMMDPPLSRAGVCRRMKKLAELAGQQERKNSEDAEN